jgi:hypothetical protein
MFQFSRNLQGHPFLNQGQLDILSRANRQVASKKPGDAARLFAQLAQEMEATDLQRRAANFHALAAHSFADAQDEKRALVHAQSALSLFFEYLMVRRISHFYPNITKKLLSYNMLLAVETLQNEFGEKISAMPAPSATAEPDKKDRLPAACPKCGAPVHSTDVNWVDDQIAECIYCGSVLQTI